MADATSTTKEKGATKALTEYDLKWLRRALDDATPSGHCGEEADERKARYRIEDRVERAMAILSSPISEQLRGSWSGSVEDFIMHGPMCRGCADAAVDGVCDTTGRACDPAVERAVVKHVLERLQYGLANGFLSETSVLKGEGAPDHG